MYLNNLTQLDIPAFPGCFKDVGSVGDVAALKQVKRKVIYCRWDNYLSCNR